MLGHALYRPCNLTSLCDFVAAISFLTAATTDVWPNRIDIESSALASLARNEGGLYLPPTRQVRGDEHAALLVQRIEDCTIKACMRKARLT